MVDAQCHALQRSPQACCLSFEGRRPAGIVRDDLDLVLWCRHYLQCPWSVQLTSMPTGISPSFTRGSQHNAKRSLSESPEVRTLESLTSSRSEAHRDRATGLMSFAPSASRAWGRKDRRDERFPHAVRQHGGKTSTVGMGGAGRQAQPRDRYALSGHNHAAPRTPLESPCTGGTRRVAITSENT